MSSFLPTFASGEIPSTEPPSLRHPLTADSPTSSSPINSQSQQLPAVAGESSTASHERSQSLTGKIVDSAVTATLYSAAVGLTAYRLWSTRSTAPPATTSFSNASAKPLSIASGSGTNRSEPDVGDKTIKKKRRKSRGTVLDGTDEGSSVSGNSGRDHSMAGLMGDEVAEQENGDENEDELTPQVVMPDTASTTSGEPPPAYVETEPQRPAAPSQDVGTPSSDPSQPQSTTTPARQTLASSPSFPRSTSSSTLTSVSSPASSNLLSTLPIAINSFSIRSSSTASVDLAISPPSASGGTGIGGFGLSRIEENMWKPTRGKRGSGSGIGSGSFRSGAVSSPGSSPIISSPPTTSIRHAPATSSPQPESMAQSQPNAVSDPAPDSDHDPETDEMIRRMILMQSRMEDMISEGRKALSSRRIIGSGDDLTGEGTGIRTSQGMNIPESEEMEAEGEIARDIEQAVGVKAVHDSHYLEEAKEEATSLENSGETFSSPEQNNAQETGNGPASDSVEWDQIPRDDSPKGETMIAARDKDIDGEVSTETTPAETEPLGVVKVETDVTKDSASRPEVDIVAIENAFPSDSDISISGTNNAKSSSLSTSISQKPLSSRSSTPVPTPPSSVHPSYTSQINTSSPQSPSLSRIPHSLSSRSNLSAPVTPSPSRIPRHKTLSSISARKAERERERSEDLQSERGSATSSPSLNTHQDVFQGLPSPGLSDQQNGLEAMADVELRAGVPKNAKAGKRMSGIPVWGNMPRRKA